MSSNNPNQPSQEIQVADSDPVPSTQGEFLILRGPQGKLYMFRKEILEYFRIPEQDAQGWARELIQEAQQRKLEDRIESLERRITQISQGSAGDQATAGDSTSTDSDALTNFSISTSKLETTAAFRGPVAEFRPVIDFSRQVSSTVVCTGWMKSSDYVVLPARYETRF